ncbi:NADP-dependent oxidoreductase [Microbacterium sp. 4R-513]|uniref:NADP-dependent oxidoreductase n=1 Tax=Microbacterium sp. 4R-513 TaxID=2567934 RepID=UPI0013E118DA|nr:NADP-dependent oxidoreductase [Microbacterium sp. 4R-513]QIG39359.1 NADP-dependent oxidoreductase [Microbacterium sp. 4R-513]
MKSRVIQATWFEYDRYGDADVLVERSEALPPPGEGEVTVEVITTSLNHMEAFLRNGKESTWSDDPWPRRSGSDFAGIVVATGPGSRLPLRSQVIGHVRTGAHASHLNVSESALVLKPPSVMWEVAGALYLAGVTALDTLEQLRIGQGDTIVVSAAAGGVGSIETQLAKHRGARVIGTCGDRNFDYLRQLGIIPVRYGDGMADRIRRVAEGPVTAFIDNFGKDGRDLAEDLGVPESRYRSSADRRDVELSLLQDDPDSVEHGTTQLARLAELARAGAFRLLISGLYPLNDIVEAYDDLAHLHSRGKVVLATKPATTYRTVKAREIHEAMTGGYVA